jgi:hypothetical protein
MRVAPPVVLSKTTKDLGTVGKIAVVAHPPGPARADHPVSG